MKVSKIQSSIIKTPVNSYPLGEKLKSTIKVKWSLSIFCMLVKIKETFNVKYKNLSQAKNTKETHTRNFVTVNLADSSLKPKRPKEYFKLKFIHFLKIGN